MKSKEGPPDNVAWEPAPPPYSEYDSSDPAPHDAAPAYSRPIGTNTLHKAKFPPALNGYFDWKLSSTLHLGPTADEKLYPVSTHSAILSNRPSPVLYDGPTNKHPIMATVRGDKWGQTKPVTITLPPRPGAPNPTETVTQMIPAAPSGQISLRLTFEVARAGKDARECFEWRKSHGNEIKDLAGNTPGWKLARLSGPLHSAGGCRTEREREFASDGTEVVALLAHNASWSLTKGFRFAFLGSGLAEGLGDVWEIIVMVSALLL
ncbi:hypothetical protein NUU61_007533 [Penicillium alfredii]|uniref:Uncharacterized protein n=1 Tax=Penicillium alfredii TaxID=1506179 RepID=A0A9W9F2V5_9EURO|nr:uncharacterized protein NUU61_007533 [Penicillium alfredii]KAJ5092663.1 hypothetical protein NUU61_007533 [Penicillium alfredii]